MNVRATLALVPLALLTLACGSDIEIEGTYTSKATWDLSQPFGRDGIGGAFADLLIEETVSTAVPGFIEDEAIDVTSAAIRAPVKALVESRLPDDLKEGGEVLLGLQDALDAVEVDTELVFTDDVEGTERLTRFAVAYQGTSFEITGDQLPEGVSIAADIEGDREESDKVKLDPYALQLRFGDFILILVDDLLGKDSAALTAATSGAVPCQVLVDEITGGDGSFDISVAGQNISISAGALTSACEAVKSALAQYALGMAHLGSGVQLEGMVTLVDADEDGVADVLRSDMDYEGRITLLPGPFEPRIQAVFEANRR